MDFSSLNIDNLENIIGSLSDKDIEQLSGIAQAFMGGEKEEKNTRAETKSEDFGIDPQMISKIMQIMSTLSKQKDSPGCDLLRALRPMLSPEKQKKTDEAIAMLRIMSLLPIINEMKG